jgi:hypothetical protein
MEALSCGVLLQDVRPPSVTPTCARLPRSFVILLRSVIERVVTAAAVICVRVGQIAPCRRGPVGSTVRLQPDHGHETASPVRVVVACRVGPRHRPGGAPFAGVRVIRSAGAAGLARLG